MLVDRRQLIRRITLPEDRDQTARAAGRLTTYLILDDSDLVVLPYADVPDLDATLVKKLSLTGRCGRLDHMLAPCASQAPQSRHRPALPAAGRPREGGAAHHYADARRDRARLSALHMRHEASGSADQNSGVNADNMTWDFGARRERADGRERGLGVVRAQRPAVRDRLGRLHCRALTRPRARRSSFQPSGSLNALYRPAQTTAASRLRAACLVRGNSRRATDSNATETEALSHRARRSTLCALLARWQRTDMASSTCESCDSRPSTSGARCDALARRQLTRQAVTALSTKAVRDWASSHLPSVRRRSRSA